MPAVLNVVAIAKKQAAEDEVAAFGEEEVTKAFNAFLAAVEQV
jgi:hypothetical protein